MGGRVVHLARLLTTPSVDWARTPTHCYSHPCEQHLVDREAFSQRKSLRFASDWKPDARREKQRENRFPVVLIIFLYLCSRRFERLTKNYPRWNVKLEISRRYWQTCPAICSKVNRLGACLIVVHQWRGKQVADRADGRERESRSTLLIGKHRKKKGKTAETYVRIAFCQIMWWNK